MVDFLRGIMIEVFICFALIVYVLANIPFGTMFLAHQVSESIDQQPENIWIFPMIWKSLRSELNLAGTIIGIVSFTLVSFLAILTYYLLLLVLILLIGLKKAFWFCFERR